MSPIFHSPWPLCSFALLQHVVTITITTRSAVPPGPSAAPAALPLCHVWNDNYKAWAWQVIELSPYLVRFSFLIANNSGIMGCGKRPRYGTSGHHRALDSLGCLGLHIYGVTSVGMVTIVCKEALVSLELNELTLHKKENLFWSDLLCLGPHFLSLELKLVSDSVISSLSKISGPIRKFSAFSAFSSKTGLSFWESWRERTFASKLHKE